ncbi:MAG: CoA transferase [Myxococcota bacterium]
MDPREAGAFGGLRILDFTQGIPGPLACMLLADLGADVIKIESGEGDRLRSHPGYLCWNRNKRRVRLDLGSREGLRAARRLAADADIAVFDLPPQGLDAQTLRGEHPRLLHVSLPPYGRTGPGADLPPDHALLSALSGAAFRQFSWEDVPVYLVTPQLHYAHGMLAAAAIAASVYERGRTGQGQELSVSGLDAVAAASSSTLLKTPAAPQRVRSRGARGGVPNYRLYRCRCGEWLFLGTLIFAHFVVALEAMDLLDLLVMEGVDGEFANIMKPENAERVIARLDERFAEKNREEWLRILHEHGVPHGPVGSRDEWFAGETVAANGMRVSLEHPTFGRVDMPGVPVRLSEAPGRVRHLLESTDAASIERRAPLRLGTAAARAHGPLDGARVLDLGNIIAGPFATAVLANFGADVIKVEPPSGDSFRAYGLGFIGFNQGKRSLALDLKRAEGREVFYEIVRQSDVVCDNYRHGVLERLQIDYETLREINPRIISASVTSYGPVGPLARDPGFDPIMQARSGLMAAQGGDDEPVFYSIAVNDVASALVAAFGIIGALHAREHTGRGQKVETSLANQSVLAQSGELTWYAGRPPAPLGDRDCVGIAALERFYACADGWLVVSCSEEAHFAGLCAALDQPDWLERWTAAAALAEARDGPLAALAADALKQLPCDLAVERLRASGVPAAAATRGEDVFTSPLFLDNDFFEETVHPTHGPLLSVRGYARWSRTPGGFVRRFPELGEHTAELLSELGFAERDVARLLDSGVVHGAARPARAETRS